MRFPSFVLGIPLYLSISALVAHADTALEEWSYTDNEQQYQTSLRGGVSARGDANVSFLGLQNQEHTFNKGLSVNASSKSPTGNSQGSGATQNPSQPQTPSTSTSTTTATPSVNPGGGSSGVTPGGGTTTPGSSGGQTSPPNTGSDNNGSSGNTTASGGNSNSTDTGDGGNWDTEVVPTLEDVSTDCLAYQNEYRTVDLPSPLKFLKFNEAAIDVAILIAAQLQAHDCNAELEDTPSFDVTIAAPNVVECGAFAQDTFEPLMKVNKYEPQTWMTDSPASTLMMWQTSYYGACVRTTTCKENRIVCSYYPKANMKEEKPFTKEFYANLQRRRADHKEPKTSTKPTNPDPAKYYSGARKYVAGVSLAFVVVANMLRL